MGGLVKIILQIIMILFLLLFLYGLFWMFFAFGSSTYDDITGTDEGSEYYWKTYKEN